MNLMDHHTLRAEIINDCEVLYKRAEVIRFADIGEGFHYWFWKNRIDQLREEGITCYNVTGLLDLRERCRIVSSELEEFSKRLM